MLVKPVTVIVPGLTAGVGAAVGGGVRASEGEGSLVRLGGAVGCSDWVAGALEQAATIPARARTKIAPAARAELPGCFRLMAPSMSRIYVSLCLYDPWHAIREPRYM